MPYTESGLPFAAGSHESHQAAIQAEATRGDKTRSYLRALRAGGKTDHEAADATGMPLSSICSIRNGAIVLRLVQKTNDRRESSHGQPCRVWALTPAGDAVLRAWLEMGI